MSNTMKSFACFVAGIALIAVVVPVVPIQYVWAQNGSGPQKRCKITQEYKVLPKNATACDRNRSPNGCYSHMTYHFELGECVDDAESYDCHEWGGQIEYRTVPVSYVDDGLWWKKAQINAVGYPACMVAAAAGTCVGGAIGTAVGGYLTAQTGGVCAPAVPGIICVCSISGGLAATVLCSQAVEYFKDALDPCCYGYCSADHTGPGEWGPMKTMCFGY